jgi:hypothetical protein
VLILAGIALVQRPVQPKNVLEQQAGSSTHQ